MAYPIDRLQPQNQGRVGDGGTKTYNFDCSAWISKHPGLTTWYIEATRPNGRKYLPQVSMDGNILRWPITKQDTLYAGYGEYMIIAEGNDGTQKASASPPQIVLEQLQSAPSGTGGCGCGCGTGNESGDVSDDTIEVINDLVANAEAAADKAIEASERAEDAAKRAEDAAEEAINASDGFVSIEHDGQGNVVIDLNGKSVIDDGNGNISII